MAVRAIRGAVQIDANERTAVLDGTTELVTEVMTRNGLVTDDVISVVFTATPTSRPSSPPSPPARSDSRTCRCCAPVRSTCPAPCPGWCGCSCTWKPASRVPRCSTYLRGAAALRLDIAQ